jgi:ribosomal protein S18 acetylase RimI-like enzyme
MRMPGYECDLDLVAVAPDGTFGAFCMCWVDPVNMSGEFEPVGTRPAFRRKGMARAVLHEGLRRMKARGCTTALVWCEGDNQATQRLYESVGFRQAKRDYDYRLVNSNW